MSLYARLKRGVLPAPLSRLRVNFDAGLGRLWPCSGNVYWLFRYDLYPPAEPGVAGILVPMLLGLETVIGWD